MPQDTFLTINDQSISLRQALGYLRTTGDLPRMIQVILRQYVIEQQIQSRPNLEIDPERLEQAIINFRLQNRIAEPESFEQWLQSQRLTYPQFRNQFVAAIKLAQLKVEVTANKVEQFFNDNKELLDQVVLSRIVVDRQDLAEELMRQLIEDGRPFEELAKTHSIMGENLVNGMMGLVMMRQLPPAIREAIIGAIPGDIRGPVEFENRYSILRVEQWQPAELKGKLRQEIQEQIFEQWVQEQLKDKEIKLHLE
jgi:parvulin-like peptidyl-prolyl isomerase